MKNYLLILTSTAMLFACNKDNNKSKMPIPHVDTLTVSQINIPYELDYPGSIVGVENFAVVPRISGVIMKQLYKEGSYVKKNQPLYEIDPRPYQNELNQALGSLTKDSAAMQQYKLILERYNKLLPVGGVSKQDVETATINYEAAKGLVETDQATIAQAKLNLEYTKVLSPVDGLIAERQVSVGDNVTAQQTTLNYINSSNDLYATFSVPENDRLELQSGIENKKIKAPQNLHFKVDIELADGQLLENAGIVDFFDTRISQQNGSWNMRANINNKSLKIKLLNGQFVHVYLKGAYYANTISIPQEAVFRDKSGSFVYVANNNIAQKKPIITGKMVGSQWVINYGIESGDQVIINGGIKLRGGEKIIVDTNKH